MGTTFIRQKQDLFAQADCRAFFTLAAAKQDEFEFFKYLAESEVPNIHATESGAEKAFIMKRAADRLMQVLSTVTGKKIQGGDERARDAVERSLRDVKKPEHFSDAVIETCKEVWDRTLFEQMKLNPKTTPASLVKDSASGQFFTTNLSL